MKEVDYRRVRKILEKYGEDSVLEMVQILKSKGSKNLQNNISQKVSEDLEYIQLVITMPEYAQWADTGRQAGGVMPPYKKIREWCISRGIPEKAAYPIAKNIQKYGTTRSAKDFLKVFYQNFPSIKEALVKSLKEDYIKVLRQVISRE